MRTRPAPSVVAGRYVLQAIVDRSARGTAWLATDTVLDRVVTVSLIEPPETDDEAFRQRLFAGARALAASNPVTLVRVLDAGLDGEVPFLVTERVPGTTLAQLLERDGRLEPGRAADVVARVLDGIAEAQAAGVAHLEVTPGDVVLADEGGVRLRISGIAASPPEPPEARPEVAAAGELLLEALTGVSREGGAVDLGRLDVPKPLRSVLARSLEGDPARRYSDPAAMAAGLRAIPGERRGSKRGRPPGTRPAVFRTWIAVPLVVAMAAALAVIAAFWLGRLELGGRLGLRIREEPSPTAASSVRPLQVAGISVLDPPPGDGVENDDALPQAIDGDPQTAWRSENYFDGRMNKPGVGLLLDLGQETTVTGYRLETPAPGFTFAVVVGDDAETLLRDASSAAVHTAPYSERGLTPVTGRYVLVWITSVVPAEGAYRAEVSDIRILGVR